MEFTSVKIFKKVKINQKLSTDTEFFNVINLAEIDLFLVFMCEMTIKKRGFLVFMCEMKKINN